MVSDQFVPSPLAASGRLAVAEASSHALGALPTVTKPPSLGNGAGLQRLVPHRNDDSALCLNDARALGPRRPGSWLMVAEYTPFERTNTRLQLLPPMVLAHSPFLRPTQLPA